MDTIQQEKIMYSDIISLGFTEQPVEDNIYFQQYGFQYSIIQYQLTKKIYLEWAKETQLCKIVRIDGKKYQNILATQNIKDLNQLKQIINFYTDDAKAGVDYCEVA